jgi:hypothetical protein
MQQTRKNIVDTINLNLENLNTIMNTQTKTRLTLKQATEILDILVNYIEVLSSEIVKADNYQGYRIVINGSDITDGLLQEVERRTS